MSKLILVTPNLAKKVVNNKALREAVNELEPLFKNQVIVKKGRCRSCREEKVVRNIFNSFIALLLNLSSSKIDVIKKFLNCDALVINKTSGNKCEVIKR